MASWQNAQQHLRHGRFGAALSSYRILVDQFPGVAQLWFELAKACVGELDFAQADLAFKRAMELAPGDAPMLLSVATQYYQLRFLDQAFACIKRAVEADPSAPQARLTLASWLERARKIDEARDCVEACLAQNPRNGRAVYFKAFLLHSAGSANEAGEILQKLLATDPPFSIDTQSNANHLLGVICDERGEYGQAIQYLQTAKTLRSQAPGKKSLEDVYDKMDVARRQLLAQLTSPHLRRWQDQGSESPAPHRLALLGGSPRSGTTLLEQILGAHPGILVFDESEAFNQEILTAFPPAPPDWGPSLKSLDGLPAPARAQSIGRYFKRLLRETSEPPGEKLLLDKNPSSMGALYIWLRLFPKSKIIIALRDPRDVIVSCYFQNIPLNATSVNFLSVERTVKYYSDIMDVWLRLRGLGGFEWLETRYEDVVGDLEKEGRRVTNFLGLQWAGDQAKFYEKAGRKFVHSPTYNAVTQPVYSRAVSRWKNYAEALAPVQAELAKYCQALGYSAS